MATMTTKADDKLKVEDKTGLPPEGLPQAGNDVPQAGNDNEADPQMKRRHSMKGTSDALGGGDEQTPAPNTEAFDIYCMTQFRDIQQFLLKLHSASAKSELLHEQASNTASTHQEKLNSLDLKLKDLIKKVNLLTDDLENEIVLRNQGHNHLHEHLVKVADIAGASDVMSQDAFEKARENLLKAIAELNNAERKNRNARPEEKAEAETLVKVSREALVRQTLAYLAVKAQQKYDALPQNLPMVKIEKLQQQLAESIRKNRSDKPVAGWSWRTMFSTDKNARALASVERLASNAAFSKLGTRTDEELEVNADLIELMMLATYALTNFGKTIAVPSPVAPSNPNSRGFIDDSDEEIEDEENTKGTPARTGGTPARTGLSASKMHSTSTKKVSPLKTAGSFIGENNDEAIHQEINEENAINKAVIDVIRQRLAEIQTRADGLIGTQNPNLQLWGKVLMTLAIAITVTLAAVALMTALGFATPTFLVPYITAVQSTTMVSAVLNFVAAKLTLDLNAAAAVTVAATAGAFGVFGKGLHMAGAPTSLKRDLDRAAQDMEAALKDTEVARNTPAMR